ncbi:MAG: thiamine pyrophosphate-dependent enzyme, partial [Actinomycetia bacterium]|nr:thiamine pyrophosphate-dependent enzyme [Actinomycetes bacterium]
MEKDPIPGYRKFLIADGVLTEAEGKKLEVEVVEELDQAIKFAEESRFPDPGTVEEDVYA